MDEWVDRWIGRHIMTRRHFEQPNKHESTGSLFLFFFQFVGYTWSFSIYPIKKTILQKSHCCCNLYPSISHDSHDSWMPRGAAMRRSPHVSSRSRSLVDGAPRGAPSEYLRWRPGRRSRIPVAGEDTKSLGRAQLAALL